MPASRPARALDLGRGSGLIALHLAKQGWSVVGVDWAEYAIELARQSARERRSGRTFVEGDMHGSEPLYQLIQRSPPDALPGGEISHRALETAQAVARTWWDAHSRRVGPVHGRYSGASGRTN